MDPIISSILGPVCERVIDAAREEYSLVRNLKGEIGKLRTAVTLIKGLLDDAETKQVESSTTRDWLKSLKRFLFDAEDILDEIATDEALLQGRTWWVTKVRKRSPFRDLSIAHKIKNTAKELDDLCKLKDSLGLRVLTDENNRSVMTRIRREWRETSSVLQMDDHIIGRDEKMKDLKNLLLGSVEGAEATSSDKNVRVISVVGMGGIGKTTLLQHAYNDSTVTEYFQLRMWVCISSDFNVRRIIGEIADAASDSKKVSRTNLRHQEETSLDKELRESSNWNATLESLQDNLKGRRFLLVLDDMWEADPSKWDTLYAPLSHGAKGSRIVVTTRSKIVSNCTRATPIPLEDLPKEHLWSIFRKYAFDGRDPNEITQLEPLGEKIVEKLKGSPLVAKTVGRLLNSRMTEDYWTEILESKELAVLSQGHEGSGILPVLKLSYDHLPGHLKQCFAYCSLFPEDYRFDKDELVQLWIAQQFLENRKGTDLEFDGAEFFDHLVHMFLFERCTSDGGESGDRYVMHDLIHDLADSISKDDCLRVRDYKQVTAANSENIRHMSIVTIRLDPERLARDLGDSYKNLRTLLFLGNDYMYRSLQLGSDHLDNLFKGCPRLRVLGLRSCDIRELPASIGTLKHLRSLDLHGNNIRELPASIGTLKHLRFLDLSRNYDITKLPESLCNLNNLEVLNLEFCDIKALPGNMSALINLRHLLVDDFCKLASSIRGLEKLAALQKKLLFDCGRKYGQSMKEVVAGVSMLRQLDIVYLEEVKTKEEVMGLRLDEKKHLEVLELSWRSRYGGERHRVDPEMEGEVLEWLLTPTLGKRLRRLTIRDCGGNRPPRWMEDPSTICLPRLHTLEMVGCVNWEVLPPLGRLPCLKTLIIEGMKGVRRIGSGFLMGEGAGDDHWTMFPLLEELKFRDMDEWEEWEVPLPHGIDDSDNNIDRVDGEEDNRVAGGGSSGCLLPAATPRQQTLCLLPRLRRLVIKNCPKLKQLPPLPPSLTVLKIGDVGIRALLGRLSSSPPSLSSLDMNKCPDVTSLAVRLQNIVELEISPCENVVDLFTEAAINHLSSLEKLVVEGPRKWLQPALPPVEATLTRSPSQNDTRGYLPSSIQYLTISDLDNLDTDSLSAWLRGLTSLRRLDIWSCKAIASLPRAEVVSGHLTALETLEIRNLQGLKSLGGFLQSNDSVRALQIYGCPQLLDLTSSNSSTRLQRLVIGGSSLLQVKTWLLQCPSLQQLFICICDQLMGFGGQAGRELEEALLGLSTTLRSLTFSGCKNLRSLPSNLRSFSSLEELRIWGCPKIRRLPVGGLPKSLRTLDISGCNARLEKQRDRYYSSTAAST